VQRADHWAGPLVRRAPGAGRLAPGRCTSWHGGGRFRAGKLRRLYVVQVGQPKAFDEPKLALAQLELGY